jgi:ABC-type transport system substrate-binding protein
MRSEPTLRHRLVAVGCLALASASCGNNPYPDSEGSKKVLYTSFVDAPRSLDPAVAYTTSAHAITGNVYDTLLEYHYLKRPFELIPGLAKSIPEPEAIAGGRVRYRFDLRPDLVFAEDESFGLGGEGRRTRAIESQDFAFQLMRIADPAVNSPVYEPFSSIEGFGGFRERLGALRAEEEGFAGLPIREQYQRAGGVAGIRTPDFSLLEVILAEPYPQLLYWFAMPFTTPVPFEAVEYWNGEGDRERFADHPVGSGPYVVASYDKEAKIVLEANPNWYGVQHPEWKAPGATYPSEGEAGDAEAGRLDPQTVGQPLPFLERVEFIRERESIPRFNKFLQGYYDASGIAKESFDSVVLEDRISPEMAARGIELAKTVRPAVYYIGFNMDDPVVGASATASGRGLRQAMSLAIDSREYARLFQNGRGVPAEGPLPPGLFGYDADYQNPYRHVDLERARLRLVEAGYRGGGRSRNRGASASHLRHVGYIAPGTPAFSVVRQPVAETRHRRRDRRHQLQPVSGEGAQRGVPDLHVGLGGGLSRPGELSLPADHADGALGERRAEYRELPERRIRCTLRGDGNRRQRPRARGDDRGDARAARA